MKILLLGEYSNLHNTLAQGLRALGHEVCVASNGDFWKDYPRDIDLARRHRRLGGAMLAAKILAMLPRLRGYDIVQLINPMFLELKAERLFHIYKYLRRNNRKIVLGGFGMDWYWVSTCVNEKPLRYSDFNIGDTLRTDETAKNECLDWLSTPKERLNRMIAADSDAIVACLYEYWRCYKPAFPQKTHFIPLPIKLPENNISSDGSVMEKRKLKLFIGISKGRSAYKGTDIMLRAAMDVAQKYPDKVELRVAEGVTFAKYQDMMNGSDAILDQLYSYTPAMNALLAMSKGIINIGGGEPESYEILGEHELRPIVNVEPTYQSVFNAIEQLVNNPMLVSRLKRESRIYVERHHELMKVAEKYENLYKSLIK